MEKNSKLLSVIVPVYKAEKYLHRCIDSILAQTWTNLEVILVDDGSPDNCGAICDDYAEKDTRIQVIHKPNGGVASARNAGIDIATGEYVAFVDSDDYIAPYMYEKLFEALASDNSIAVCDFMMDYGNGDLKPKTTIKIGDSPVDTINSLLVSDVGGGCVYMISPRDLISELRFPGYLQNGEDKWFILRLFARSEQIVKVASPMYFYNQSNSVSLTHGWSCESANKCVRGYEENLSFIRNTKSLCGLEKEWAWSVLRFKSVFVMDKKHFNDYRLLLPEANIYVSDCPLVSPGIKMVMGLLNHHMDTLAAILVWLYKMKRCVTHI